MKTNGDDIMPVEVFRGLLWEAELVRSLLSNAEIEAYLKDEINGNMAPWVVTPGGMGAVKVIVSNEDSEKAKIVVEEFENNRKSQE